MIHIFEYIVKENIKIKQNKDYSDLPLITRSFEGLSLRKYMGDEYNETIIKECCATNKLEGKLGVKHISGKSASMYWHFDLTDSIDNFELCHYFVNEETMEYYLECEGSDDSDEGSDEDDDKDSEEDDDEDETDESEGSA